MSMHIIDLDADPVVPDGFRGVEEHVRGGRFEWNPDHVGLYLSPFLRHKECIGGEALREELMGHSIPSYARDFALMSDRIVPAVWKEMFTARAVFNSNLLDFLLEYRQSIPEEFKNYHVFFFGTILRSMLGGLCVRCLYWEHRLNPGRWLEYRRYTGDTWYAHDVVAVRVNPK